MELGEFTIPISVIGATLALFAASLVYGLLIMQSLTEPIAIWIDILRFGVLLFVVYLFYRFVLAVERIAAKL